MTYAHATSYGELLKCLAKATGDLYVAEARQDTDERTIRELQASLNMVIVQRDALARRKAREGLPWVLVVALSVGLILDLILR